MRNQTKAQPGERYSRSLVEMAAHLKTALEYAKDSFIPTPFPMLNQYLEGGISGFTVVGAAPKMGKSALVQQIALHAAERGYPVLYIDLEHSWVYLTLRMVSSYTGRPVNEIKEAVLRGDFPALPPAMHTLCFWHEIISPRAIVGDIRTLARPDELSLIVVDSIQKLPRLPRLNKRESADHWLRELEAIKNHHRVVILAVSELSRGEDGKNYDRPTMASFKESGDIEYTAEQLISIAKTRDGDLKQIEILANRFGRNTGLVHAWYSQQDFNIWRWTEV